MESRALGSTELKVPSLGLGTVKIGRNRDVKYPEAFALPGDEDVRALLEAAVEEGVVFWDTAPAYGRAEERLGPFVREWRDRLLLCTKVGEEYGEAGSHHDFTAAAVSASVERSLRRLRTDVLDVVLLHSDGRDREVLESTDAVEALVRAKDEGKIRAVGISAKTVEGIDLAAAELDVVMAPLSTGDRRLEAALLRASDRGCGVLAIKVLGQGHGVGGADDAQARLRASVEFVVTHPAIDVAVIGTSRAEHLRQIAALAREAAPSGGSPR